MKIIVNAGRTVHRAVKPGVKLAEDKFQRPVLKAHGPTHLIDLPDEEAQFLISRGFAHKYEAPKVEEVEKVEKPAK